MVKVVVRRWWSWPDKNCDWRDFPAWRPWRRMEPVQKSSAVNYCRVQSYLLQTRHILTEQMGTKLHLFSFNVAWSVKGSINYNGKVTDLMKPNLTCPWPAPHKARGVKIKSLPEAVQYEMSSQTQIDRECDGNTCSWDVWLTISYFFFFKFLSDFKQQLSQIKLLLTSAAAAEHGRTFN